MTAESPADLKFEIGHVLFMDIVGYSKLLITEQSEVLRELTAVVRETEQFRIAEAEGKLVQLPTGDGMALVFRNSAEAPVRCALAISEALKAHPELQLRMGIHSGPVNEVTDVNKRINITGAGINIAQRVMDCGDAGHILLSKHIADDFEQYPQWRSHLHDLGECEVKHGVRVHVVNLYTDELGNPETPEKFKQAAGAGKAAAVISAPIERSTAWRWATIGAAVLVLAAVVSGLLIFLSKRSPTGAITSTAIPEKSIAVLPFENLSEDKANAYFAEGIQDEILTRLAKIADLKVISRMSTAHYASSPGDVRAIAKQLGVANILEGSVQKAGDNARVNVQLVKAATGAHLWAESFDRQLTDIFRIESEIAKSIADTLQAKLSGAEQSAIAARPTENNEAHDLYLRGRYFFGKRTADDFKRAIDYFNQAIAQDSNYAPAYAGIADSYVLLPQYSHESPADVLPKARAAADKALAIDDNLAEAHVSRGLVLQGADLNLKEAKREFERALELNPNYAAAHYFLGLVVLAPWGQFDQAIAEVKRAIELDPFSVIMNTNLGYCYLLARRYPEAIAQLRKATELDPNFPYTRVMLGAAFLRNGDSAGAMREYEKAYEVEKTYQVGPQHFGLIFLAAAYALQGDREKALQLLGQIHDLEQRRGGVFSAYGLAAIYVGLGEKEQAIDWLERSYRAKETGVIGNIKVDPFLDPLRGDPRFEKLANQIVPPDSH